MKKCVLIGFLLSISCSVTLLAQNKTLGVGVATPSPNAALHVESPTGNQGFIMPRLTSTQRTAPGFLSALSANDVGLMVYDLDSLQVYTWTGSKWDDNAVSSNVTGNGSAGSFSVNNAGNSGAALYAKTNGTGPPNTSAAILGETATAFSAITGISTGPGGSNAVSGLSSSSNAFSFGVYGNNTGAGIAGMFQINNASNASNAFESTTNGTGGAGKFTVNNLNSIRPSIWAETNSNQPLSAAIYGLNTGTGDVAASFRINNAASTFPALFVETNGTGRGATIRKTGTTGAQPGLFISTAGGHGLWTDHNGATGYAAIIQNINTANGTAGMLVESIGSGPSVWFLKSTDAVGGDAIMAQNLIATGRVATLEMTDAANFSEALKVNTAGQGSAGVFEQTHTGVFSPALIGRTAGQGAAISGISTSISTNANAAEFIVQNPANPRFAVFANTIGTGAAGNFSINNGSSTAPAIFATTNGTGSGIAADNTSTGDAVFALKTGPSGSAGNFQSNNATNPASTIFGMTNAPTGTALGLINSAEGNALAIFTGGMKVSSFTVAAGGTVTTRAAAYYITGGSTFTLSFPQALADGEVFFVYNSTGSGVTFGGAAIGANSGKTCIYLGGALRPL